MEKFNPSKAGLPLVDLHRHLEGSIRIQTVIDVSRKYHLDLPSFNEKELESRIHVNKPIKDIRTLYPRADLLRQIFVDFDVCRRVADEFLIDAKEEGLDYIEVRFSPLFLAELHKLDPSQAARTLCQAFYESSKSLDIEYGIIITLTREFGADLCEIELDAAISNMQYGVVALDLAGDELRYPSDLFADHFIKAKAAGLHLIAHAGEFHGAKSVIDTIKNLKIERIGHGVRAIEDEEAVALIKDKNIFIECCPTSNYLTSAVKSLESHPIAFFIRNSMKPTINTDDPTFFQSITLKDEYKKSNEFIGLTPQELYAIMQNGVSASFNFSKNP